MTVSFTTSSGTEIPASGVSGSTFICTELGSWALSDKNMWDNVCVEVLKKRRDKLIGHSLRITRKLILLFIFTGIGIAGKEGRQASLAADFSIPQFSHLARLIMVHGRNSYKRSASLSQFVIHRGLIISTMQAIFSAVFYFSSVSLYQGWLMVG